MKKNFLALFWSLGIGVPLIAVASGGYYLFHSENAKNANISAEIASKTSRTDTASNSNYGTDLPAGTFAGEASGIFVPAAHIEAAYIADNDAVTAKTDPLFSNPTTAEPKLAIKTDPNVQAQIDALRVEITKTLDDWQALVQDVAKNGPSQNSDPLAEQYANDVQKYIAELKVIVDGLTPDNSSLTPEEITSDQAAVDAAITEADQAIVIIDKPMDTPPSSSSGTNNNVNNTGSDYIQSSDQSNSSSTQDNTPFKQPDTGAPHLIEGSNSI